MKTLAAIITKTISTTAMGSAVFMATQIVSPLKTKNAILETHVPRMTIRMDDFSPAWSAMEDDYRLGDYEEETIPENMPTTKIVAGVKDYFSEINKSENKKNQLELPRLSLSASQDSEYQNIAAQTSKAAAQDSVATPSLVQVAQNQQSLYNIPHYWLHGKIELTGGLAITNPRDQVSVGWFKTDDVERKGMVSLEQGTYELKVDRLEGEVIAQLIDSRGDVLGEALIDLEVLAQQRSVQQMIIDNVDIKITPYNFSAGQTISVYNTKVHHDPVAEAMVRVGQHDLYMPSDEKGQISKPVVTPQSMAVVSTSKSQYRESLALVNFDARPQMRMFPEKFLHALFETVGAPKAVRDMGMIWGMVTQEGEPVSNYKVQLANYKEYDPIYFSFYIADKNRRETSTDGQFAMLGLPDHDYEVELVDPTGKVVDGKVVAVRAGYVSQAEFEVGHKKTVNIRPFDPLSPAKVDLDLAILGADDHYAGKSENFIPVSIRSNKDPLLVFAKPQQTKIQSSTFASRQKKFQDIPILNDVWWEKIKLQHDIQVKEGAIVGFIDTDQPFEVFVENLAGTNRIVYFNARGEIVDKTKGGMANGFIIYNAGQGLKTLILQTETGFLHTEIAYVDGESVSLIYKKL